MPGPNLFLGNYWKGGQSKTKMRIAEAHFNNIPQSEKSSTNHIKREYLVTAVLLFLKYKERKTYIHLVLYSQQADEPYI